MSSSRCADGEQGVLRLAAPAGLSLALAGLSRAAGCGRYKTNCVPPPLPAPFGPAGGRWTQTRDALATKTVPVTLGLRTVTVSLSGATVTDGDGPDGDGSIQGNSLAGVTSL